MDLYSSSHISTNNIVVFIFAPSLHSLLARGKEKPCLLSIIFFSLYCIYFPAVSDALILLVYLETQPLQPEVVRN